MGSSAPESPDRQSPDPRTTLDPAGERDMRPVVDRSRAGLSGAAVAAIAAVAGLGLFGMLEARRQNATAPATTRMSGDASTSAAPPPLYVPPAPAPATVPSPVLPVRAVPATPSPAPVIQPAPGPVVASPAYQAEPSPSSPAQPLPRNVSGSALVLDASAQSPSAEPDTQDPNAGKTPGDRRTGLSTARARAAMLANRSTTVPQGTLIPAVLETAFDSTSPGFARALVQKDVHGFDGTRVLIPRGSRLIGEYGAETAHGQKRAVILWSRLIRPDGVTIALLSPAADTVGRGGVKADVNNHFLERFSGAILQSALDVGVALAARNSRSPVIVALPGSTTGVASTVNNRATDITPTLRVPAGRSVSVFVARDLDFTDAEGVR